MASPRSTARIARPAHEVGKTASDTAGISAWSPAIEAATAAAGTRSGNPAIGHQLQEQGPDSARVVCSTQVIPGSLAELTGPSVETGVHGLRAHLDGGS